MNLPDFLTLGQYGEIRLTGHRVDLAHLVHYYNDGYSPEMLWTEYPDLPLALIYKALAFYLENQSNVDAYLAEFRQDIERKQVQPAAGPALIELRRRLESMRQAQGA